MLTLDSVKISPRVLLVSLDVVTLFTWVQLEATLELLEPLFPFATVKLFKFVSRSTYFSFEGQFYEQFDEVSMGSPLSPVVADLCLDAFEITALQMASMKHSFYRRYVDYTFLIWPHEL